MGLNLSNPKPEQIHSHKESLWLWTKKKVTKKKRTKGQKRSGESINRGAGVDRKEN